MKVMQAPIEIAGQMGILSKGLQPHGVSSVAYNYFHTYLDYREHRFNVDGYELERMLPDAVRYFDLFHFHYGYTLTPNFRDLKEIKKLGKKMLMHHWGNDVRTHAIASLSNPYVYTGDSPSPEQIDQRLKQLTQSIDHAIVQDYEVYPYLVPYYKHIHILPLAFPVRDTIPVYPSLGEENPLIIHAPTQPRFKGTEYIENALQRLKEKGLSFRYKRIEGMSNRDALKAYQEADLVVDQILCGSYGLFAVEGMSLGKPVVGYIREDLALTYPEMPPIVSANPTTIAQVLEELIKSRVCAVRQE
ncbi:conserved hypothetical protein [[Clostridium] ultunense Esp]|nr:conserved hypothetical protein [[Clostridium] ultunense Esp]